jgi:hypothetical protein
MEVNTPITVVRFDKLNAGDLFVFSHVKSFYVALLVEDPLTNDKLAFPLGPTRPSRMKYPSLMLPKLTNTVISFGNNYQLKFPSGTKGWTTEAPPPHDYCLLLIGSEVYIRADFGSLLNQPGLHTCYVDLRSGRIKTEGEGAAGQFSMASGPGPYMFLTEWAFVTGEKEPQQIVVFSPS